MSRIAGFVRAEEADARTKVLALVAESEERLGRLGRDKQADEDDMRALQSALSLLLRLRGALSPNQRPDFAALYPEGG